MMLSKLSEFQGGSESGGKRMLLRQAVMGGQVMEASLIHGFIPNLLPVVLWASWSLVTPLLSLLPGLPPPFLLA